MRHASAFLVLAAPLVLAAADGTPPSDGLDLDTKIDRVTVYSDRARVTRTGPLAVKDGRQRILVSGLPHDLDADSVSAALPGKHGARILSIEVEDAFGKRVDKKEAEALITKAEDLQRKVKATEDELGALAEEEAYLRSFQVRPRPDDKGRATPVSLEPNAWGQTLSFVSESLANTLARTRTKQKERKDLLNEIQAVGVELGKVRSYERLAVKRVALEVEGSKAETVSLEVTYAIAGPGWRPAYDVRVLSSQGKVEVITHGVVRQATGEDWTNVDLTLSTAFPEAGADVPELLAWRLGDQDQYAVAAGSGRVGNMDPGRAEIAIASTTSKDKKSSSRGAGKSAPSAPPPMAMEPSPQNQPARASKADQKPADRRSRAEAYLEEEADEAYAPDMAGESYDSDDGQAYGGLSGGAAGYAMPMEAPKMAGPPPPPPPPQIKSMGPGLWSLPAGRAFTFMSRENDGFSWSGDVLYCPSPRQSSGGFDYSFKTDRRRTVGSDGKERKVKLAAATFPATLLHEVVAPLDKKAYLKAHVKNDTRQPFLAGEAFVFLDEDFVGRSFFSTVAPTAQLDLSLGVDEDIKVDRRIEQTAETTGLIGKKDRTVFTIVTSVRSYKKRAVEVLLRDQMPVTWQKDDISVEKLTLKPEPEEEKTLNTQGLYSWRLKLAAGGKDEVKIKYVVEHPRDFDLVEQRSN